MTPDQNSDHHATDPFENSDAFSERILLLAERAGSISALARKCGIGESTMRKWAKGDADPGRKSLVQIAERSPCDLLWLVTGGYEVRPERPSDEKNLEHLGDTFVQVPLYDVEAAAGHGSVVSAEPVLGHYAFRRDFIRSKGWQIDQLALIWARGESMPGVIENGQLVLVNLAVNAVHREGVYVLRIDEQLVIKAVQPDHRGNLLIHSTSSLYRDITVPRDQVDELEVIAQAVWTDQLL